MVKTVTTVEKYGKFGRLRPVLEMDAAIEWDGYNWLNTNAPEYLASVEHAVSNGYTPEEIRAYTARMTGDRQIALRCEHAAKYLFRLGSGE